MLKVIITKQTMNDLISVSFDTYFRNENENKPQCEQLLIDVFQYKKTKQKVTSVTDNLAKRMFDYTTSDIDKQNDYHIETSKIKMDRYAKKNQNYKIDYSKIKETDGFCLGNDFMKDYILLFQRESKENKKIFVNSKVALAFLAFCTKLIYDKDIDWISQDSYEFFLFRDLMRVHNIHISNYKSKLDKKNV